MDELRPCPFCGGVPLRESRGAFGLCIHERTCRNEATDPEVIFDCSECLAELRQRAHRRGLELLPQLRGEDGISSFPLTEMPAQRKQQQVAYKRRKLAEICACPAIRLSPSCPGSPQKVILATEE